jgi:hypothetical protein
MSEQVFADGIGPIVVVGGTVRLDFITFIPDEGEAGSRPKPAVQHRLFMPTEAFLMAARRFSEAAEAIAKLEQERAAQGGTAAAPAPVSSQVSQPVPRPVTPQAPEPAKPIAAANEPFPPVERPKPPFP